MNAFRHNAAIKKEAILEIARNGGPRPGRKTKLGVALMRNLRKSHPNGPAFLDELKALRPDWFLDTVDINKAEILEIARDGEPRPSEKTKLGQSFSDYIKNCGGSFDKVVRAGLKAIRPEWFRK